MFRATLLVSALSAAVIALPARSQDAVRQLLAGFARIDADGDGLISRAEFRDAQAARWSQIDRNGDGYLSEDDFPPGAARRARAQLAEIAHLDANGDGRISQDDFLSGPAPVFGRADRNGDGALARSELEAAGN